MLLAWACRVREQASAPPMAHQTRVPWSCVAPSSSQAQAPMSARAGRVLVTADSPVPFSSLVKVPLPPGQPSLWRLTSPQLLSHAWLSILFEAGWQVANATTWAAYPRRVAAGIQAWGGLPGRHQRPGSDSPAPFLALHACRNDPPEDFSPFLLARGLWYNNALESVADSLEAAAISALNTALLVKRALEGPLAAS